MNVNSSGSPWPVVPSVTLDVSALPRMVAFRLPGRRVRGAGGGSDCRLVMGRRRCGSRRSPSELCCGTASLHLMLTASAAQEGGTQGGPRLHGYQVPAGARLLPARPSLLASAWLGPCPPHSASFVGSQSGSSCKCRIWTMKQNCLICVVSVGKIYPFSFISSGGVIKCAGDSCVGNISRYIFHLLGAGISGF